MLLSIVYPVFHCVGNIKGNTPEKKIWKAYSSTDKGETSLSPLVWVSSFEKTKATRKQTNKQKKNICANFGGKRLLIRCTFVKLTNWSSSNLSQKNCFWAWLLHYCLCSVLSLSCNHVCSVCCTVGVCQKFTFIELWPELHWPWVQLMAAACVG